MHEASIALNIIDIAGKECRRANLDRVKSISVNIGSASGVLSYALLSAFDIVKAETIADKAALIINDIPLGGKCSGCGTEFTTEDMFILGCPSCESKDFKLTRGRELDITEIEAE